MAEKNGTPTLFPPGIITATPGGEPILITPQPTVANAATAQAMSAYATAVAITGGTFTPTPKNVVFVYPTATPWPTATPVFIGIDQFAPSATPTSAVSVDCTTMPIWGFLKGKILAHSNRFGEASANVPIVMNPDGSVAGSLTSDACYLAAYARESYSPDRQRRAIVAADDKGRLQIWIQDLSNDVKTKITNLSHGIAYDPAWSPAGGFIAYVSTETGNTEIWLYDMGNRVSRQLIFSNYFGFYNQRPSWSPDGNRIVFKSNRTSAQFQIWIVNSDGSGLQNLSQNSYNELDPVWVKP